MEYIKKEYAAYNVHIIKTKEFKTVTFEVNFLRKEKKEEITIRNFLSEILVQSSKNYPTKRLITKKSMELYNANIISSNSRIGNLSNLSFSLNFLNEKYTEPNMFKNTLDFFFEVLFNPLIINNEFDLKTFKVVKKLINNEIKSVKDNMTKYSLIKMLEHLGKNEAYAHNGYGYLEDLELITPKTLYEYYNEVLKCDKVDIMVIGDVEEDEVVNYIHENFKINTVKKSLPSPMIFHDKIRSRAKKEEEWENIAQSKLNIGFKLKDLSKYELRYVLPIFSEILGGGTSSKLFQNVREKNSLAYYINSMPRIFDNLFVIYAGINKSDFDKTVNLIKKELTKMKKGKISDEELENAKKSMITSVDTITDSQRRILNMYYTNELIGGDDILKRIETIKNITKEDVVRLANKLKIDTIYLMYGGE